MDSGVDRQDSSSLPGLHCCPGVNTVRPSWAHSHHLDSFMKVRTSPLSALLPFSCMMTCFPKEPSSCRSESLSCHQAGDMLLGGAPLACCCRPPDGLCCNYKARAQGASVPAGALPSCPAWAFSGEVSIDLSPHRRQRVSPVRLGGLRYWPLSQISPHQAGSSWKC